MATNTFDDIKARQQVTWSSGDYGRIAWITVPLADVLCEAVDPRPGATVLDVATGTGHVALSAARRFCTVTGVDYVPALLDVARQRSAAEGLDIDFREADAEHLPFDDASFDAVLSAIGAMFTPDQEQVARELGRVCVRGGRIGMANWTPDGFVGEMLKTVGRHVPPPAGLQPPTSWGTEERVRELLADHASRIECTTRSVAQRFPSAEYFADFFLQHYGPTFKASEALAAQDRPALREDLVDLARRRNRAADSTVACDWEYLVVVATRS